MENKVVNFFANASYHGKAKIIFYGLGFLISISFFSPEEINAATHTPPISVAIPFLVSFVGLLWFIFDLLVVLGNKMVYRIPKKLNLYISFHFYGIIPHSLIVAGIILYSLDKL